MSYLKSLVKDTVPVLIGVLLALFIGEWQQNKKDKDFIESMFVSIRKEAISNLEDLESVRETHHVLLDTISHYMDDKTVSIAQLLEKTKGFKKAEVKNSTWNAVISQRIDLVPYDVISSLSDIEISNQVLEVKWDKQLTFLFDNLNSFEPKSKDIFKQHIINIIDSENKLIELHSEFLAL